MPIYWTNFIRNLSTSKTAFSFKCFSLRDCRANSIFYSKMYWLEQISEHESPRIGPKDNSNAFARHTFFCSSWNNCIHYLNRYSNNYSFIFTLQDHFVKSVKLTFSHQIHWQAIKSQVCKKSWLYSAKKLVPSPVYYPLVLQNLRVEYYSYLASGG